MSIPLSAEDGGTVPLSMILGHHAARSPTRAALVIEDRAISYCELDARSNRRARMFASRGVGFGDFVTVALPNGLAFYETSFAIWKLGAIPNIVAAKSPVPELRSILDIVRPRLLVGDFDPDIGVERIAAGELPSADLSDAPLDPVISPHWKAMTSGGSTGRPKVIVDRMAAQWNPAEGFLCQQPGDTVLNPGPLYHNAPFYVAHACLFVGGTVVEMNRFDARRALDLIDLHRVNWVNLVPTMMHRIWQLGPDVRSRYDLSSLRMILHMAAPCPAWLKEAWICWLGAERVWEYYGTTEGTGSTMISGADWLEHRGSVGKVRPGAEIAILDEHGRHCPPGHIGEVHFLPEQGVGSTYYYMGSQAKLNGDWESNGDLGSLDQDGYLYLADRRNDLIISGGANIYPAEVEAVLDAHPAVRTSAVIGLPDEEWGARVHAIVQPLSGVKLDQEELLAFLAERLARYKLPKEIEFTAEPLRDDAGKVRRSALRDERIPA
ncbi:AMP-binding protein [Sphingomonas crusticola]|uniref:AMP-binding protein n=1 Tax=Sphingomonas crusticola TaxID=1697973 RepID=UPI000E27EDD7|nr:AMP-binding protein [Sphingomonas crusticola]